MKEYERLLGKAKIDLIGDRRPFTVFYTSLLYGLQVIWDDPRIPTAAVDGRKLYMNIDFWMGLTPKQRIGLLAHEALHVAYRHLTDFDVYNRRVFPLVVEHRIWNHAGDYMINRDLVKAGYVLPPGGLYDDRFAEETTLTTYKILHDEIQANGSQPGEDGDLIFIPSNGGKNKKERDALKRHIDIQIAKAAETTKRTSSTAGMGLMPDEIYRIIDQITKPKLDFRVILANYMVRYAKNDYTMRRPNRRYFPDYYLPSLHSEAVCDLAMIFDVSGSISDKQMSLFNNALRMVKQILEPEKITLLTFDTEIRSQMDITQSTNLDSVKFLDGGGTSIAPVLEWIKDNKPEVTLVFTDGEFWDMNCNIQPRSDLIWIIHNNNNFTWKFGKVIHHELEDI